MSIQVCLIITPDMYPIPEKVQIIQRFGPEKVVDDNGRTLVEGTAMHLKASAQEFADWLLPFNGIWSSESPATGKWEVVHVKPVMEEH